MPAHVYPRATAGDPADHRDDRGPDREGLRLPGPDRERLGDVYYRVEQKADYGKLSKRTWTRCSPAPASSRSRAKRTRWTSRSGRAPSPASRPGTAPGARAAPAGTSSAPRCRCSYLGDADRHPRRRPRPHLPAPRERDRPDRGVHRRKCPSSRFWVHNGLLQMGEEKMSKSLGNLITIREASTRYGADGAAPLRPRRTLPQPLTYQRRGARWPRKRGASACATRPRARGKRSGEPADIDPAEYQRALHRRDGRRPQHAGGARRPLRPRARDQPRPRRRRSSDRTAQAMLRELAGVLGLRLARARTPPSPPRPSSTCSSTCATSCATPSSSSSPTASATASPTSASRSRTSRAAPAGAAGVSWR